MTKEEAIKLVQSDFENVITYSQNYCQDIYSDKILDQWYENKKDFIESMGGLIYEIKTPVNFELSLEEQTKKIDKFIKALRDIYHNEDLGWFINANRNGFFSNYVVNDYEYNGKKIPKGMKLVKAFKFFFSDPEIIDMAQSEASRIIQENKVEGILCFSVHPLDFLSSSENTYNWRSCHALDGEFRAGNLSYMCDNATVICYLKSANEDNVRLSAFPPTIPWNSKKWRMLMYVNTTKNALFAGRQYPMFCENALETLKPYFVEALGLEGRVNSWSHWHNDQIDSFMYSNGYDNQFSRTENKAVVFDCKIHILDKFVKDQSCLHFNDVLKSTCYKPFYCWHNTDWGDTPVKMFKIGSKPICPSCGERELENSDILCCSYCYDRYYNNDCDDDSIGECSCCGHLLYEEDDYIYVDTRWESDVLVCGSCAARECTECPECGETVFNEVLTLDPETKEMICTCCFDRKYPNGITSGLEEHIIPNHSSPSETSYPVRNFRLSLPDTPSPHAAELTDFTVEATNTADLIQRARHIPGLQEELARWVDNFRESSGLSPEISREDIEQLPDTWIEDYLRTYLPPDEAIAAENAADREVTFTAENSVWDRELLDGVVGTWDGEPVPWRVNSEMPTRGTF